MSEGPPVRTPHFAPDRSHPPMATPVAQRHVDPTHAEVFSGYSTLGWPPGRGIHQQNHNSPPAAWPGRPPTSVLALPACSRLTCGRKHTRPHRLDPTGTVRAEDWQLSPKQRPAVGIGQGHGTWQAPRPAGHRAGTGSWTPSKDCGQESDSARRAAACRRAWSSSCGSASRAITKAWVMVSRRSRCCSSPRSASESTRSRC
jgi:hypothetical protein